MKVSTKPSGMYQSSNGTALPKALDLNLMLFDSKPMCDEGFAALLMQYHFKTLLSPKVLKGEFNLGIKPHEIASFALRYCEIKSMQHDPMKTINLKQCITQMKRYTPREYQEQIAPKLT